MKKFKKTTKKVYKFVMWLVGAFITLGVAGLFISGAFMSTFLSFFPLIIHQIIGWIIILGFAWGVIGYFLNMHK
jgi:apolipoprotein N-acyltransferase